MVDPLDVVALDDVRRFLGQELEPVVISHGGFRPMLNHYPSSDESVQAMIKEIKGLYAS